MFLKDVNVTTVAAFLSAVSTLFAVALLWGARTLSRLPRDARSRREIRWIRFSVVMGVGNVVLLLVFLWFVSLFVFRGSNPSLVVNPQLCPPRRAVAPFYPCDPDGSMLLEQLEVQTMWVALKVALVWFAVSVWVLIEGVHAGRLHATSALDRPD